jgi:hypothetical protein
MEKLTRGERIRFVRYLVECEGNCANAEASAGTPVGCDICPIRGKHDSWTADCNYESALTWAKRWLKKNDVSSKLELI